MISLFQVKISSRSDARSLGTVRSKTTGCEKYANFDFPVDIIDIIDRKVDDHVGITEDRESGFHNRFLKLARIFENSGLSAKRDISPAPDPGHRYNRYNRYHRQESR